VRLHAGIDLSGVLGSVARWADDLPDPARWRHVTDRAGALIAERIGRAFDVVLSDGIVSQLCVPLYRRLAARPPEWATLMEAVGRVHVGSMQALLRPGGTGILVGDFAFAAPCAEVAAPRWDALPDEVRARLAGGALALRRPDYLIALVAETPGLVDARLTEPWLWSQPAALSLAYAVLFRREDASG
jgi:hypothetical protein